MGIHNPAKGITCLLGGVVGNTLSSGLVCAEVPVQNSDSQDVFIRVNTVGAMTDLRVRAFVTASADPAPFVVSAVPADWAPLPAETIVGGVATQDPYEAGFAAAQWFPADDRGCAFRVPAVGTKLVLVLFDAAGAGAGSNVDVVVYLRRL